MLLGRFWRAQMFVRVHAPPQNRRTLRRLSRHARRSTVLAAEDSPTVSRTGLRTNRARGTVAATRRPQEVVEWNREIR